jgi:hypothetical protein
MEPDVKQEQQQAGEDEQQQQEQVAEPAEVKQEEVKKEEEAADEEISGSREVSDDELREKLLQMLQESDLSTVTGGKPLPLLLSSERSSMLTKEPHWLNAEKMLRKQLEEQLGVKLADKKQLIRQEVGSAAVAKHKEWQLQACENNN